MYRVYSIKDKEWVDDDVYLTPYGDLFVIEKGRFGKSNMVFLPYNEYACHMGVRFNDKNDKSIYEGDIVRLEISEDKFVIGEVVYASDHAKYVCVCYDESLYYEISAYHSEHTEIIGNVFDTPELLSAAINNVEESTEDNGEEKENN